MTKEIEEEIVRLLRRYFSTDYIIAVCHSLFGLNVSREEIREISKKYNLKKILEDDEVEEISNLSSEVKISYLEYITARNLYVKLSAALNGFDSSISPEASMRKICDVYDRMFSAMNKYHKIKKETENTVKKKFDNIGLALYNKILTAVRRDHPISEENLKNVTEQNSNNQLTFLG
jgi:hypothetical protein